MGKEPLWTFDRFESGHVFGTIDLVADAEKCAHWTKIYGAQKNDTLPRGMIVVAMMECFIRAIQPRPSGNIHAGQELVFTDFRPRWGATLSTTISCAHKQEKKGRFWVEFGIVVSSGGTEVLSGTNRLIWAK